MSSIFNFTSYRRGASLVEVILAVALFGLFATALVGLVVTSFASSIQVKDKDIAALYAQEGIEAASSIRRQAWNLLENGDHGVTSTSGAWLFDGVADVIEDGRFTRVVSIDDACRNSSDELVSCDDVGAVIDPHAKLVRSRVEHTAVTGVSNSITLQTYLTTWQSRNWVQTDWSDLSGQSIWLDPKRYSSSTGINAVVSGSITLAQQSHGWIEDDESPLSGQDLFAVAAISSSDVWAAGASGRIYHFDGNSWTQILDTGNDDWNGLAFVSSTDGWLVGSSGRIYHFDGNSWTFFDDVGNQQLNGVSFTTSSEGWAVGQSGKIYRFAAGAWTEFDDMGNNTINAVDMVSITDGWAVGPSAKFYHYDGSAWSEIADLGTSNITSIDMLSATDGWAAGASGQIYHYDGNAWTQVFDTGNTFLTSIRMLSPTDGWVAGDGGDIYHYDGLSWTSVSSPVSYQLAAITFIGSNTGWIVGNGGTVLVFTSTGYATSGELESSAFNTGGASAFNFISWTEDVPPQTDVQVQLATAPDAGGVPGTWSMWKGVSGAGSYYANGNEVLIPITNAHNDDQWVKYKILLSGDGSVTPHVSDITVNYTP